MLSGSIIENSVTRNTVLKENHFSAYKLSALIQNFSFSYEKHNIIRINISKLLTIFDISTLRGLLIDESEC